MNIYERFSRLKNETGEVSVNYFTTDLVAPVFYLEVLKSDHSVGVLLHGEHADFSARQLFSQGQYLVSNSFNFNCKKV